MNSPTAVALRRRRIIANVCLAGALLVCLSLSALPPTSFPFYPSCPIHQYLGILCPGCGDTRALAALVHGHLLEALRLNALFVLLLPLAIAAAVRAYLRSVRPGEFRWPRVPPPALAALLFAAAVFAIARNVAR